MALFLADAHLQRGAWTHRSIFGDAMFAFEQSITLAIQLACPVFSAGDLFDVVRPPSDVIRFFVEQIGRLAEAGLPFLQIQGNHEFCDTPWASVAPHATWLHGKTWTLGKEVVYGLDWQPADKLAGALEAIPPSATMLLCHQVWGELTNFSPEGSLAQVPTHIHTVVTGDCHQSRRFEVKRPAGAPLTVVSPGALAPQSIAEPATPFVWIYGKAGWVDQPLKHRPVVDIQPPLSTNQEAIECLQLLPSIVCQAAADAVAEEGPSLPAELLSPLVTVTFVGEGVESIYRRQIEDKIRALGAHPFSTSVSQVGETEEVRVLGDVQPVGRSRQFLAETIQTYFEQQGHDASWSQGLQHLLTASDRREALGRMRKEAGVEIGVV